MMLSAFIHPATGWRALGLLLLAFWAAGFGGLAARADGPVDLTVTIVEFPPQLVWSSATQRVEGSAVDALQRLGDKCGASFTVILSPSWTRAYTMARSGKADGIMPLNFAEDRQQDFFYTKAPVFHMRTVLVVHRNSPVLRFDGLSILDGKTVGKLDNALIEPAFDAYITRDSVQVSERHTFDRLIENVARGRLDFAVGEYGSFRHWADVLGHSGQLRALDPPIGVVPVYLGLTRADVSELARQEKLRRCLVDTPVNEPQLEADSAARPSAPDSGDSGG